MIKKILKWLLPKPIRRRLVLFRKHLRYNARKYILKLAIKRNTELKIILGAAETYQEGWLSTNEQWLDITNKNHWVEHFGEKKLISRMVAEHVFEHLTDDEVSKALKNIKRHLVDGGKIRIAVPDGYNPNPDYIRHVCIGGIGDDARDHKQLFNIDSLSRLMINAGLKVEHVEGYKQNGELIQNQWLKEDGFILRSRQNNSLESWNFEDATSSLIVDGSKHD